MLAAADDEGLAVDERPDAAVGCDEEPEAAERAAGPGDQRAAVQPVLSACSHRLDAWDEPVETASLQFPSCSPFRVDDEK